MVVKGSVLQRQERSRGICKSEGRRSKAENVGRYTAEMRLSQLPVLWYCSSQAEATSDSACSLRSRIGANDRMGQHKVGRAEE